MSLRLAVSNLQPPSSGDVAPPTYVAGGSRSEVFAHFRSGLIVRAGRTRQRNYPGLRGAAPPTTVFYGIACQLPDVRSVLDLGSGSGDGSRRLCARFEQVTGIDSSSEAVTFARQWCPLGSFVHGDATRPIDAPLVDLVVVADVLGHLQGAERALVQAGRLLNARGVVLVAEPAALPLQRLASPARRGYSVRSLGALLTRTGFRVRDWVAKRGTFVGCIAEPVATPDRAALVEGLEALEAGQADEALCCLESARQTGPASVQCEASMAVARAHLMRGNGDAAARALMAAAAIAPRDARPIAGLAELSFVAGDVVTALRLGLEAGKLDPTEPTAARIAGFAALELEHRDALSAIRVANNLAPDDFDIARALSEAAARLGDTGTGIAALERVRAYGDDLGASLHVELARNLLAHGRRADAELEARLARAKEPEGAEVIELWKSFPVRAHGSV